jgi:hypothetical protein
MRALVVWLAAIGTGHGQTLLAGSQYYDSFFTLAQVVIMQAAGDKEGLAWQAEHKHAMPAPESKPIIVIAHGAEPDSPTEFYFVGSGETHLWTFSSNVLMPEQLPKPSASPTPAPSPAAAATTPSPTPMPKPTATPIAAEDAKATKRRHRAKEAGGTPEEEKVWHQIDGKWKWYDKRYHVPRAKPVNPE